LDSNNKGRGDMPRAKPVINPITEQPLDTKRAAYVRKLRKARKGAQRAMRSGNPAKRAEAAKDEFNIVTMIRQTYTDHASGV
jgi:hypothetical protein